MFVEDKERKIDCVCSLYDGLVQVQQDDYVSSVHHQFILLMLACLWYHVTTYAALFEKPKSGQTKASWELDWIATAIESGEEEFEKK